MQSFLSRPAAGNVGSQLMGSCCVHKPPNLGFVVIIVGIGNGIINRINRKCIMGLFLFILILNHFFRFCLIWALGGSNIRQKNGGRLTKILPARQTNLGEFLGQPFAENTYSKNQHNSCGAGRCQQRGSQADLLAHTRVWARTQFLLLQVYWY